MWGVRGGVWVGLGGQSGCERRIEVFVKIQQKKNFFWGGGGGGRGGQWEGSGWGGGQDGCERIIQKKKIFFWGGGGGGVSGGSGWGVRVDVNKELKFL